MILTMKRFEPGSLGQTRDALVNSARLQLISFASFIQDQGLISNKYAKD
jgi:hypothetical protein